MEAGHNFEVSVDLKKMNKKTNRHYWRSKCDEIVKVVCALLNTFGGKLSIKIENEDVADFENVFDNFLRATEQRLKQFMSLLWLNKLVKMPNIQNRQFVYEIRHCEDKVFTIKYHLYLPTLKQVEEIPPSEAHERIKEMSVPTNVAQNQFLMLSDFICGKSVMLTESDSVQFKNVSNEKSVKTTIADRIINESNKLSKTLSAFANQSGGQVFYGISNDGIVHGQKLEEKDKSEIEVKVAREINKLIWLQKPIENGKHWNIEFIPVKDEENNIIVFLFVVRISIQPLPGGVFVQQPESYLVGRDKKVQLMSFEDWRSRTIYGVTPVPASVSRIKWSSTTSHKNYFKETISPLNELQCQANYQAFNRDAKSIKEKHAGTATELFVMFIESVVAYKRGMMKKANEIIKTIEVSLENFQNIDDRKILEFRLLYAKSAIARAEGCTELSYKYAKEGQQVADCIQPGVLTAWFLNHVAIVEKFLSEQERQKEDKAKMEKSALNHFIKALQHAKASDIEQEFTGMIADLEQRIHVFRAITILGNFATGASLSSVTPSNIKAAKNDLVQYENLVYDGFLPSNYRKTYSLYALCDLRFAQWYQQHLNQQQKQGREEPQQKVYKTPPLLKEAYDKAFEGRNLSKQCRFEELIHYGNCRLGQISEMMVTLNYATLLKRRRDSRQSQ